jgi:hypothetical protein
LTQAQDLVYGAENDDVILATMRDGSPASAVLDHEMFESKVSQFTEAPRAAADPEQQDAAPMTDLFSAVAPNSNAEMQHAFLALPADQRMQVLACDKAADKRTQECVQIIDGSMPKAILASHLSRSAVWRLDSLAFWYDAKIGDDTPLTTAMPDAAAYTSKAALILEAPLSACSINFNSVVAESSSWSSSCYAGPRQGQDIAKRRDHHARRAPDMSDAKHD